ncbi:DHA2 family efflux MFS transporter permease subunit [Corynebacterium sp. NML130628]|uniref:DHA2 family efflux MFS transporter permease subunit n=1 Tax=Corynebacterium sp. NML130628 TaxID=1906333 RepID=UPI000AAC0407|nr:DHA2 family efflux MFS transporter permease subunit [Corynebacterium sp. NML130628]
MDTPRSTAPWAALWSMMVGFFVILVDSTIVAVAIPAIASAFDATYNQIIWVNSSYLLAYAVPLLVTGRLGDRVGPRTVYLFGLSLFTAASLACGLATSIEALILARAVQGFGGALVTPQTMSVMLRTFPPKQRGGAMGVWGATAGVATIVGPLLGGLLVDAWGWAWIFIINVPVGIVGVTLAWFFVPKLEQNARTFDWVGVVLSALGMFCLVFGIQEGQTYSWSLPIVALMFTGAALLAIFVWWQTRTTRDPLVPLELFSDRNYSLACVAISTVGFAVSTYVIPWMIYVQNVQHYAPTQAAMLLLPAGLISGCFSPWIGKLTNTHQPKPFAIAGLSLVAVAIGGATFITDPDISPMWLLVVSVINGFGNSMVWGPLSMIATRNLDPRLAGAGSSVYNTVRQLGAVIGSAGIAAMMSRQLTHQLGPAAADFSGGGNTQALPDFLHQPFAQAMSTSMLLPLSVVIIGVLVSTRFVRTQSWSD